MDVTLRDLVDPERLSAQLVGAGVPALVEFERLTPGRPGGCVDRGEKASALLPDVVSVVRGDEGGHPVIARLSIRPAAMPRGTSLHFIVFDEQAASGRPAHQLSTRMSLVVGHPVPCRLFPAP